MKAITWKPGTNLELDTLFDQLREKQHQDRSHRLWKNYARDSFNSVAALTIYFNANNEPELCSSITNKDCWPVDAYRILNRTWKPADRLGWPRGVRQNFGSTIQSQINWLKENTNCKLHFISREKSNWEDWCIESFLKIGHEFKKDNYKYLTCSNECDNSCWQAIIYNGDEELLTQWKRQLKEL